MNDKTKQVEEFSQAACNAANAMCAAKTSETIQPAT